MGVQPTGPSRLITLSRRLLDRRLETLGKKLSVPRKPTHQAVRDNQARESRLDLPLAKPKETVSENQNACLAAIFTRETGKKPPAVQSRSPRTSFSILGRSDTRSSLTEFLDSL